MDQFVLIARHAHGEIYQNVNKPEQRRTRCSAARQYRKGVGGDWKRLELVDELLDGKRRRGFVCVQFIVTASDEAPELTFHGMNPDGTLVPIMQLQVDLQSQNRGGRWSAMTFKLSDFTTDAGSDSESSTTTFTYVRRSGNVDDVMQLRCVQTAANVKWFYRVIPAASRTESGPYRFRMQAIPLAKLRSTGESFREEKFGVPRSGHSDDGQTTPRYYNTNAWSNVFSWWFENGHTWSLNLRTLHRFEDMYDGGADETVITPGLVSVFTKSFTVAPGDSFEVDPQTAVLDATYSTDISDDFEYYNTTTTGDDSEWFGRTDEPFDYRLNFDITISSVTQGDDITEVEITLTVNSGSIRNGGPNGDGTCTIGTYGSDGQTTAAADDGAPAGDSETMWNNSDPGSVWSSSFTGFGTAGTKTLTLTTGAALTDVKAARDAGTTISCAAKGNDEGGTNDQWCELSEYDDASGAPTMQITHEAPLNRARRLARPVSVYPVAA